MNSKYTGIDERKVRSEILKIRGKMRECREKYLELERLFFKLNGSIDNKYKVKNFKI